MSDILPRVVRSLRGDVWHNEYAQSLASHVVVPVSAVVTRECDECQGEGGLPMWRQASLDPKPVPCPKCGGSGTLEAVRFDPYGILEEGSE